LTKDYYSMIAIFRQHARLRVKGFEAALPSPRSEEDYERYTQHQETVNRKTLEIEDVN